MIFGICLLQRVLALSTPDAASEAALSDRAVCFWPCAQFALRKVCVTLSAPLAYERRFPRGRAFNSSISFQTFLLLAQCLHRAYNFAYQAIDRVKIFARGFRSLSSMSRANKASKRKRRTQVVPILGAAGLSLSLASGAGAIGGPAADMPTRNTAVSHRTTACEEEISEVSLATFYIFDKENARTFRPRARLAAGGGCGCGCGGCAGCAGCATGAPSETSTLGSNIHPPYYSITPAHKHTRTRTRPRTDRARQSR